MWYDIADEASTLLTSATDIMEPFRLLAASRDVQYVPVGANACSFTLEKKSIAQGCSYCHEGAKGTEENHHERKMNLGACGEFFLSVHGGRCAVRDGKNED